MGRPHPLPKRGLWEWSWLLRRGEGRKLEWKAIGHIQPRQL